MMDKYVTSPTTTVLHLIGLYYTYDPNDIIVNIGSRDVIEDFESTGDNWDNVDYTDEQIISLSNVAGRATYFDWLEHEFGLDLNEIIKRSRVDGEGAHGYYPVDVYALQDVLDGVPLDSKNDKIIDVGSGKGSGILALQACGFSKMAGIEFTEPIYQCMCDNLERLGWNYQKHFDRFTEDGVEVICLFGDAGDLTYELDEFNWFFFFNPFSEPVFSRVLNNICVSLRNKPRKVRIVYAEPMCHKQIMNTGRFRVLRESKTDFYNGVMWFYLYESLD